MMAVLQFLFNKFLRFIAVLVGVTLITFLLMHAIPGNPWSNYSSSPRMMSQLTIDKPLLDALKHRFGLDLPLWRQFTRYMIGDFDQDGKFLCGVVCGNLGPSIRQRGRTVQDILFGSPEGKTFIDSRFGYSIRLVLCGSIIAVGLGVPLGILSTRNLKSGISRTIAVSLAAMISIPNFILGLLAVIVLASWLKLIKILPDWNDPVSWIIPAIVLAVMPMASIARVTRASLINIVSNDYVRAARAKGLTQSRVMVVHVMRNALVPIITFLGPTLMELFTGLLIVESLYAFPGFGQEYYQAVLALDYPMILGLTLFFATGMVLTNILIEILSEILDPRIRSNQPRGVPV